MDYFEFGCRCLETPYLKSLMDTAGVLGRGVTAPAIGLGLVAFGYYSNRPTLKRTGWAVLISLATTALLVNLLKIFLQMPRPTPRSGFGFPSGDSGMAFSFVAVMGAAFPALAPVLFLLATLTSIARLYFRAHYVWDIVGGAAIGILCGRIVASRMLTERPARSRRGWTARMIWSGAGLLMIGSALFFLELEAKIAEHKRNGETLDTAAQARWVIDFGTPAAQPYLLKGWSANQHWRDPPLTINWVEGLDASLTVSLEPDQDGLLRLRAYPYRSKGFLCQRIDVSFKGQRLGRIYLEQDWNTYEIKGPKNLINNGPTTLDFRLAYADTSNWHGVNPERKPLSVAFDFLELRTESAR